MTVQAPRVPTENDGDRGASAGRGSRLGRAVALVVICALVSMWGYVLYLAFGPGRQPPIDRLDDPAFAEAAEERCATALEEVGRLPVASASHTAAERADVLARANGVYAAMLDDLEDLETLAPAGDQRQRAGEWLADWRTYLGDRQNYATALRTDPDARLLVSAKPGKGQQITGWIDEFANANRMPSCVSPTDA
ncbi:MAG TPA: hypothetical protein VFG94_12225 [Acidimicrobiales bacterium]|nr:hypothetical protein [Acidimicrobiales bacterium]